uniref:NADH-ubiquinone oxidoreductase chain 1 n=1 Tax=Polytoxus fuscovittatus TaxID=1347745 RepID=A0A7I6H8H5_9HEMI|nr:NADH dehydrogenase subunit 1 [Polytoxus fuscovittatus]
MFIVFYLMIILMVLISVAFVTLMERKVLGYIQLRKGPNKVGVMGILQPFSDGLKLFFKECNYPLVSNFWIFYFSPVYMMLLSFFVWVIFPLFYNVYNFSMGLLFFLSVFGMSVYGVLMCGWGSNSKFSLLGALRSVSQIISYEVSLAFILINYFIYTMGFNFLLFFYLQKYIWFIFLSLPLFFCWLGICLAETNRAPFDFAEGESELVSGFNVEYSSVLFAFIFLSEYMNIIFFSMMTCIIFLGCDTNSFWFYLKLTLMIYLFIWFRGTLPRYRYDKLMNLTWFVFLPLSLFYFLFNLSMMINLYYCTKLSS